MASPARFHKSHGRPPSGSAPIAAAGLRHDFSASRNRRHRRKRRQTEPNLSRLFCARAATRRSAPRASAGAGAAEVGALRRDIPPAQLLASAPPPPPPRPVPASLLSAGADQPVTKPPRAPLLNGKNFHHLARLAPWNSDIGGGRVGFYRRSKRSDQARRSPFDADGTTRGLVEAIAASWL